MDKLQYKGTCYYCKNAIRNKVTGKIFEVKCKLGEQISCQCAGTEDYFELDKRTLPRNELKNY